MSAPTGYSSYQKFTPEQMNLFRSLFSQVGPESRTARLAQGDEDIFSQIEAPALRQFSGIQGGLASRFSGMGMGGRHGSGFQHATNQAAQEYSQDLQSKRQQLQRQALQDLFGFSESLLGQQPTGLVQKPPSFWEQLLQGSGPLLSGLGKFGGLFR
jgi:hypothetical protein